MLLLNRAKAFLLAKAVERGDAVSALPGDAVADLIVAYEERLAMVLEGRDIDEAGAHRIATAECGASIAQLDRYFAALAPERDLRMQDQKSCRRAIE
ncbi:MAG: hypothetical protein R3D67_06305 [Hyphomicrobiaceae bacterium]